MSAQRIYLIAAAASLALITSLYWMAFEYQFGAPIKASYDLYNWRWLKERIAERTPGRRILLVGDSNTLFGMDSAYAERELGRPVINLGLHGGQSLDWLLDVALRQARAGDTVVLPLWFAYYTRDYRVPNDFTLDQVVAWDKPYYDGLSFLRKLRYIAAVSPSQLYTNMRARENREAILKEHPDRRLLSPDEAEANYNNLAPQQSIFSYSYVNIDQRGDVRHTCGKRITSPPGVSYGIPTKLDKTTLSFLLNTVRTLRDRGVQVYFVAPVQWDYEFTRSRGYQLAIRKLWKALRRKGVPVLGEPTDYFFPAHAFFDTDAHLNCDYATERTARLVNALKPVIN